MGAIFNIPVAFTAINKGFKKSFGAGFKEIEHTVQDAKSHLRERNNPWGAYFSNPLELRVNQVTGEQELFWPKYNRSITASLRRNAALLRLQGAPKEEYEKAKAEWKLWKDSLEPMILNLSPGVAVQFLALRALTPEEGVAFQQVSWKDGELVLESQLLPLDQADQIGGFKQLLNGRGVDINLSFAGAEVDPAVTWAVQGPAIDFKENLPRLVDQAIQPILPEFLPIEPRQFQPFSEIYLPGLAATETPLPISAATAFGFAVDVKMSSVVKVQPTNLVVYEADYNGDLAGFRPEGSPEPPTNPDTSGPDTTGPKDSGGGEPTKPRPPDGPSGGIILEANQGEELEEPTRRVLVGPEVAKPETTKTVFVARKVAEPVIEKEETPVPVYIVVPKREDQPTGTVIVGKKQEQEVSKAPQSYSVTIKPSGFHPEGKEQEEKAPTVLPPLLQIILEPINDKEIPFWQPNFAAFVNDNALVFVVVTMFFLIANTTWVQRGDAFFDFRGSGEAQPSIAAALS